MTDGLTAVNVVDDAIDIDTNNMVSNAFYTITYRGEQFIIQKKKDGKIYIFQQIDSYQDPPSNNEQKKPWIV